MCNVQCAMCRRLIALLERFGAFRRGIDEVQHRLQIGVIPGLNNFTAQPFDFAGDIRMEDIVVLSFTQPFQQEIVLSSDSTRFFDFP